ncbi:hypothetical protein B4U80_02176 [Leptotrombidium deliense]|uniref:Uncharacterized protein n=1 Tax=Leptotrombidium deliense TaxID=299467 RepID=A0A443S2A5_9ACAR|nr:hypothetical protein B4U80_02176 [Leptotrombidium deliense]
MDAVIPQGGYYLIADFSQLAHHFDFSGESGETKDWKFAKWLSKHKGSKANKHMKVGHCCQR